MKAILTTPSDLHGGIRLIDFVLALVAMFSFLPVRLVWDSDWAMVGFLASPFVAAWSRRHIWPELPAPSAATTPGATTEGDGRG